ncbi:MAG: putative DNA-binding domain-containing protein [Novosphingobium sp.]|nr:putative DNA-binding domain-containing protein [Novosphingobium sp.]MCP5402152.1 putative DNA-binding domain-containing protein [Novosphingobium sp.]
MRLEALQHAMMAAIDDGPDHIPEGVFAGGRRAVLHGMAVHANTISHARLVALEDTFPRTRRLLGEEEFNRLSRGFVETAAARAEPVASIGRQFPFCPALRHASRPAAALAEFEWAWLESYHAAEADALDLGELAGVGEVQLLALRLSRHPAARMVGPDAAPAIEGEVPSVVAAAIVLLARPGADVLVVPATPAMGVIFGRLEEPREVGELLSGPCGSEFREQDMLPALIALIEAGALVRLERDGG